MAIRFRKSIKLFPGVRIHLSRSGVSTTVGPRGAHITIGTRGTRTTVGIPGTGLSVSETARPVTDRRPSGRSLVVWLPLLVAVVLAVCFALARGGP